MKAKKQTKPKTKKPTAEEIQKAQQAAAEKAAQKKKELEAQIKSDQEWVDTTTEDMTGDQKEELFHQLSQNCKATTYADGKITIACPVPRKLSYCVYADSFSCPNGTEGKGCKLSPAVSEALKDEKTCTCIDAVFVSKEEGGSYRSPYVPWGPINGKGKDGKPVLTTGNNSGVTIGTGVDLGAMKQTDLDKLTEMGVSQDTVDKLKPLIGKKREEACKALREAKGDKSMVLDAKDVELIDQYAMKKRVPTLKKQFDDDSAAYVASYQSKIDKESKKKKPDEKKIAEWQAKIDSSKSFEDLSCADQTALFSTLYHEGSINKKHMKPYVNALIEGDEKAAYKAMEAKTKNSNKLIAARGKEELQYLKGHPSSPPPSAPAGP